MSEPSSLRDPDWLRTECRRLSRTVFRAAPSDSLLEAYVAADRVVFAEDAAQPAARDFRRIERAVREGWDVEALELHWRRRDRLNPLTKKLATLVYLLETDPGAMSLFVNERDARARAFAALAAHAARTLYKAAKGAVLWRMLDA